LEHAVVHGDVGGALFAPHSRAGAEIHFSVSIAVPLNSSENASCQRPGTRGCAARKQGRASVAARIRFMISSRACAGK
jgi:hypothetical protein